jgi:hypothetical protein
MNLFLWVFELALFATTVVALIGLYFLPIVEYQYQEILQILRSLFYAWIAHAAVSWTLLLLVPEGLTVMFTGMQCLHFFVLSMCVAFFAFASSKYWVWLYFSKWSIVILLSILLLAQGFVCIWLLK